MGTPPLIGFGDADSFYASAEAARRPWLTGLPVGVLGNQGASVIARARTAPIGTRKTTLELAHDRPRAGRRRA